MGTRYTKFKQGIFQPQNPQKNKGKSICVYRSSFELKFMRFLDQSEAVLEWSSESLAIDYINPLTSRISRYYPDFLIKYHGKDNETHIELIEIKPYRQTIPPNLHGNKKQSTLIKESRTWAVNQEKWKAARIFCEKRNIKFRILTEKELNII